MERGEEEPADRLDLHGKTRDQAREALLRFVERSAVHHRHRLVLVITGKGLHSTAGEDGHRSGVLQGLVPQWLDEPPANRHVLQWFTAHSRHGGEGALYVCLKRPKGVGRRHYAP